MKTINITALEWFDKINRNSYFAAKIEIDKDLETMKQIVLPFQYGYSNQYEDVALKELQNLGLIDKNFNGSLSRYCSENNIELVSTKIHNCTKKELKDLK